MPTRKANTMHSGHIKVTLGNLFLRFPLVFIKKNKLRNQIADTVRFTNFGTHIRRSCRLVELNFDIRLYSGKIASCRASRRFRKKSTKMMMLMVMTVIMSIMSFTCYCSCWCIDSKILFSCVCFTSCHRRICFMDVSICRPRAFKWKCSRRKRALNTRDTQQPISSPSTTSSSIDVYGACESIFHSSVGFSTRLIDALVVSEVTNCVTIHKACAPSVKSCLFVIFGSFLKIVWQFSSLVEHTQECLVSALLFARSCRWFAHGTQSFLSSFRSLAAIFFFLDTFFIFGKKLLTWINANNSILCMDKSYLRMGHERLFFTISASPSALAR